MDHEERRETLGKRDQRAVQALATKGRRESLVLLGPLVLLAPQDPRLSFHLVMTALWFQQPLELEGLLDHQAPQVPRDHQEMMENRVILVRTEKLVLRDLQASQEPQVTLEPKEKRETVERVSLVPEDLQGLLDLQAQDTDLLLWTWRAQGSRTWTLSGVYVDHLVLLVPLVFLVLLVFQQQAPY